MGNKLSNNAFSNGDGLKPATPTETLEYIVSHYILTMDFKSLKGLHDPEYCNNLVILTSDVIEKHFTTMDVEYLAQKIKNGKEINETINDKLIFFNKNNLDDANVQSTLKKKRMCAAIGKFYVKIAHIFAAIVMTINPVYAYKDENGTSMTATLFDKHNIPANATSIISKLNICDNRINALQGNADLFDAKKGESKHIVPKICSIASNNKSLKDEPGIPELRELYNDADYNFDTGKFEGMTDKTKKQFHDDLGIFYERFTGNAKKTMADNNIKDFNDIKLNTFDTKCNADNTGVLQKSVTDDISNNAFKQYADHMKNMIQGARKNQLALMNMLGKIFKYTIDPSTKKKNIRINPDINETNLQQFVVETRKLIITLYLQCELEYTKGIYLYEKIVLQKTLETTENQSLALDAEKDKLYSTSSDSNSPMKNDPESQTDDENNINVNAAAPVAMPDAPVSIAPVAMPDAPMPVAPVAMPDAPVAMPDAPMPVAPNDMPIAPVAMPDAPVPAAIPDAPVAMPDAPVPAAIPDAPVAMPDAPVSAAAPVAMPDAPVSIAPVAVLDAPVSIAPVAVPDAPVSIAPVAVPDADVPMNGVPK